MAPYDRLVVAPPMWSRRDLQASFYDFSSWRERHFVDHDQPLRPFHLGDRLIVEPGRDVIQRKALAGGQNGETACAFAEDRVLHGDDRRLQHGGMPIDCRFHVGRIYLDAPTIDDVLVPARNRDVSGIVDARQIPGPEPAIVGKPGLGCFVIAVIPVEYRANP